MFDAFIASRKSKHNVLDVDDLIINVQELSLNADSIKLYCNENNKSFVDIMKSPTYENVMKVL